MSQRSAGRTPGPKRSRVETGKQTTVGVTPRDTQPRRGSRASKGSIDAEHAAMIELLDRIERTESLPELSARLAELRELLHTHFAREEASDGMHQLVTDLAPRHLPHVQHLLDEHQVLRKDLVRLESKVMTFLAGPHREIVRATRAFSERLRKHEAHENEIFADAMYEIEGGQG